MNLKALIMCLCILTLWSCKKYEEGPAISFRSAEKRVVGEWKIYSYVVNGVDSMAVINELGLQGLFRFGEYFNTTQAALTIETNTPTQNYRYAGIWSFQNKYQEMSIGINRSLDFDIKRVPLRSIWKIMKLTYKEHLWLRLEENGRIYELRFKPYT